MLLSSAEAQLAKLSGWKLTHDGKRIRKEWQFKNFVKGMAFLNRVAEVAESEMHHPDLHLEGYRNVWIEIWTHAIGGSARMTLSSQRRSMLLRVSLSRASYRAAIATSEVLAERLSRQLEGFRC